MNKALILGASSLLLILTILLLLPNKTYDHSAIQHTTFKQTGMIVQTSAGRHLNSWASSKSSHRSGAPTSFAAKLSSSRTMTTGSRNRTDSYSGFQTNSDSHSYTASGIHAVNTSSKHYTLLSMPHISNNSQNSLQIQTHNLKNKVYANRAVGVNTTYQMANQALIAQTNNSESTYKPFADIPVIQQAMMDGFPDVPGEIAPLGQTAALLIFGLTFLLIKIVVKEWW